MIVLCSTLLNSIIYAWLIGTESDTWIYEGINENEKSYMKRGEKNCNHSYSNNN